MPIEYVLLNDLPEPLPHCPACGAPFRSLMRGMVQNWWRRLTRQPYCAVICFECKQIVGYEKPPQEEHRR
jgi:hypothetical protein